MNKGVKNQFHRYIFLALIAIMIIISYKIIQPYILALISSFILAFLAKPLYSILNKKLNSSFSAILCITILTLIILIPLALVVAGITQQAYSTLNDPEIKSFFAEASSSPILKNLNFDFLSLREKGITFIINIIASAFSYLPSLIVSLIIIFFGTYYILINWNFLASSLENYLPFENKKAIAEDIAKATKGILYGTLIIAVIEALIAGIGFGLLGIKAYLLLTALIFILAFIPNLGPALVWIPLAIIYLLSENYPIAIGIIIIGVIMSLLIDTFLRTKILGETSNIHPLLMLVGILGGLSVFGIFGFIIGPLILLYTIKLIQEGIKNKEKVL